MPNLHRNPSQLLGRAEWGYQNRVSSLRPCEYRASTGHNGELARSVVLAVINNRSKSCRARGS